MNAILEGAARVLESPDLPFTTNHVAKMAGVSIGSLYQYFGNAQAIVAALIHRHVEEEVAAAKAILSAPYSGPAEAIASLAAAFVDAHAARPSFTSKLHALAPIFGLATMMNSARDAQADAISNVLGLDETATRLAVAAVEGALLRQLSVEPMQLQTPAFLHVLTMIALSPFDLPVGSERMSASPHEVSSSGRYLAPISED